MQNINKKSSDNNWKNSKSFSLECTEDNRVTDYVRNEAIKEELGIRNINKINKLGNILIE
jgi:hypothetical protein